MTAADVEHIKHAILQLRNQHSETARYLQHYLLDDDEACQPFELRQNQIKYTDIKAETGIHRLDELSLQSWYLFKKSEIANLQSLVPRLRADCVANSVAIATTERQIQKLQKCLVDVSNRGEALNIVEQQQAKLDAEVQKCRKELEKIKKSPIQLEEIVEKLERLQATQTVGGSADNKQSLVLGNERLRSLSANMRVDGGVEIEVYIT